MSGYAQRPSGQAAIWNARVRRSDILDTLFVDASNSSGLWVRAQVNRVPAAGIRWITYESYVFP